MSQKVKRAERKRRQKQRAIEWQAYADEFDRRLLDGEFDEELEAFDKILARIEGEQWYLDAQDLINQKPQSIKKTNE